MTGAIVRYFHPEHGQGIGLLHEATVFDVSSQIESVSDWLKRSVHRVNEAVEEIGVYADRSSLRFNASLFDNAPAEDQPHWLAPVDTQDIWASGVTYIRSRAARQEEAIDGGDVYARVYDAERPELFFKAKGSQVIGPLDAVGIRQDATWSVPEPELAVVMNPAMEVVGFSVGNDMSSRDIEGENPLYLPQAKMYRRSCSLGIGLTLMPTHTMPQVGIEITIERDGKPVLQETTSTSAMKRTLPELVGYLGKCMDFPDGVVLLTGTGIVPPSDFTLHEGDIVRITIEGIGSLTNTVVVV